MKAKSINVTTIGEVVPALETLLSDGFKPNLAIVFISIKQDRKAVIDRLQQHHMDVIGATSSGEFTDIQQTEGGISMILLDIKKEDYQMVYKEMDHKSTEEAAKELVQQAYQSFRQPALILLTTLLTSDGKMMDGEGLVMAMEKTADPDISMFGGMAGDDLSFAGTWVFANNQTTDYGLAALVLNEENIELQGLAFSGWKPLGVSKMATKTEGHFIYSIDDAPALEVYLRYLGYEGHNADDRITFFDTIGVHYPFQIERENREPKMCNPIGYDKDKKALICESDVPQGSSIRFSMPPDFDIIDEVVGKANDLKKEENATADALLIFSCAGRLSALGPLATEENEGLSQVWKAPMAGFFTYGEYGKGLNGKHEFHSTTCSWVTIKEK